MSNVIPMRILQGSKGTIGPIKYRRGTIRCKVCGNTEVFIGVARVEPRIIIEQVAPGQYDVIDVEYDQTPETDEIPVACGKCQSHQLEYIESRSVADEPPF